MRTVKQIMDELVYSLTDFEVNGYYNEAYLAEVSLELSSVLGVSLVKTYPLVYKLAGFFCVGISDCFFSKQEKYDALVDFIREIGSYTKH